MTWQLGRQFWKICVINDSTFCTHSMKKFCLPCEEPQDTDQPWLWRHFIHGIWKHLFPYPGSSLCSLKVLPRVYASHFVGINLSRIMKGVGMDKNAIASCCWGYPPLPPFCLLTAPSPPRHSPFPPFPLPPTACPYAILSVFPHVASYDSGHPIRPQFSVAVLKWLLTACSMTSYNNRTTVPLLQSLVKDRAIWTGGHTEPCSTSLSDPGMNWNEVFS